MKKKPSQPKKLIGPAVPTAPAAPAPAAAAVASKEKKPNKKKWDGVTGRAGRG
jgi:hypothetical protein